MTPRILAHRGLVTAFQENTLAAIQAALDSPYCHGAEFDVFLTTDDQVVLFHDENMLRLTGVDALIREHTWEQLSHLSIQKTLQVDGGTRHYATEQPLVLLSTALAAMQGKTNADGSLFWMDIELKAYAPDPTQAAVGMHVARLVKSFRMENQCVVSSFNYFMIAAAKNEHPLLKTAIAYDDTMPMFNAESSVYDWLMNGLMESNWLGEQVDASDVIAEHTLLDEDSIEKLHAKSMRVGSYTLFPLECDAATFRTHAETLRRLATHRLDWIETDQPQAAYETLALRP